MEKLIQKRITECGNIKKKRGFVSILLCFIYTRVIRYDKLALEELWDHLFSFYLLCCIYLINFSDLSSSVVYSNQLFTAACSILNILSLNTKRNILFWMV